MQLCFKAIPAALILSCFSVGWTAAEAPVTEAATEPAAEGDWIQLFNGADLTGWDTYLGPRLDENLEKIPGTELGLNNDPEGVFTVTEEDGGQVIRISGVIGGGISTVEDYENYHLRLQVKWGEGNPWQRDSPDSGLLYHAGGEHGADADYWLRSFEYQVMPDAYGDFIAIEGCVADVPSAVTEDGDDYVFDPNGERRTFTRIDELTEFGGSVDRLASFQDPVSDWVTLELYTVGQTAVHVVDGEVVAVLYNTRLHENGVTNPLTSGKIQFQSEGSEVFYRNIELQHITELPAGLIDGGEMAPLQ